MIAFTGYWLHDAIVHKVLAGMTVAYVLDCLRLEYEYWQRVADAMATKRTEDA